jgi:hypothetical protein
LKTDAYKRPPASSSVAPTKFISPGVKAPHGISINAPGRGLLPRTSGAALEERRKSQRVLLRVRASIHVALQGSQTTMEATTLSVNTQGAVIVIKQNLPPETRFVLEHGTTRERVACKVARPAKEMPEGFHVPVEFDTPAPHFWKIAFPPADWRPLDEG